MRIAYLGAMVPPELAHKFSAASVAGSKYQLGMLSSFREEGVQWDPILLPPLASFPRERRILVSMTGDDIGISQAHVMPCLNVVVAKQLTLALGILVALMGWAYRTRHEKRRAIVVYNAFSFMAGPTLLVSRLMRVPAVVVVADVLPKGAGGWLTRLEERFQRFAIGKFNALIPITDHIGPDFAPGKPFIRLEGGVWDEAGLGEAPGTAAGVGQHDATSAPARAHGVGPVFLYAGSLDENSNIQHLLEAFSLVDVPEAVLIILGRGPLESEVRRAATQDPRIDFRGFVDNAEAVRFQHGADVLVSPRLPDSDLTRYTFPSKLFEYLATGKPVVCVPLPGIPAEYASVLTYADGTDPADLARALEAAAVQSHDKDTQLTFLGEHLWTKRSSDVARFLHEVRF